MIAKHNTPLVSVITVVFNNVNMIENTICSVLNQSYKNIEYIVIDGGSTDGTLDIISQYKDQISRFVSEPDNGIYDAMNKGIKLATGDIVGIINSDDTYNLHAIELIANNYDPNNKSIFYGYLKFDSDMSNKGWYPPKRISLETVFSEMLVPHPTMFVPREFYIRYGMFDENLKITADYGLVLNFLSRGIKFHYIESSFPITIMSYNGISDKLKNSITIVKERYHIRRSLGKSGFRLLMFTLGDIKNQILLKSMFILLKKLGIK